MTEEQIKFIALNFNLTFTEKEYELIKQVAYESAIGNFIHSSVMKNCFLMMEDLAQTKKESEEAQE